MAFWACSPYTTKRRRISFSAHMPARKPTIVIALQKGDDIVRITNGQSLDFLPRLGPRMFIQSAHKNSHLRRERNMIWIDLGGISALVGHLDKKCFRAAHEKHSCQPVIALSDSWRFTSASGSSVGTGRSTLTRKAKSKQEGWK